MPIPKIIWQTWTDPNCLTEDRLHPIVKEQLQRTRSLNPTYQHNLLMGDDMDNFVKTEYSNHPEILECYDKINITVAKVDLWRYLALYKYGGVYLDMDSAINRPLDELIRPIDNAIISAEGNPGLLVMWAQIFAPNHPLLKEIIDHIIDNINHNRYPNDVLNMTGPAAYTRSINKYHSRTYGRELIQPHEKISPSIDITYTSTSTTYRLYGVDYNNFLVYKYPGHETLCQYRPYWRTEIETTTLLKEE